MKGSLALLAPILLIVAAFLATLHGFRRGEQVVETPKARQPRYQLLGAEWTRYDAQGRATLHATADTIRYYDDKSAELEHLNMDRLGSQPGPWHLTAPRGYAPANQQRMQLTEPVKMRGQLKNGEPLELTAETLWVDYARREVYTDSAVNVTAPYREVDAVGMRADWAGTRLQLLKNVRVTYATRS